MEYNLPRGWKIDYETEDFLFISDSCGIITYQNFQELYTVLKNTNLEIFNALAEQVILRKVDCGY